ncbi:YpoC family protein [Metabacillus dongyingensis]|uniref:YpoC family protein n=1 Tax=Metabacillus dongyingensis TaxID=2874282 RepID=UPI003B8E36C4
MLRLIDLPEAFKYEPFFCRDEHAIPLNSSSAVEEIIKSNPFYFDICFKANVPIDFYPWKNPEISIPVLIDEWHSIQETIKSRIRSNARKADKAEMIKGISILICLINWSNETPIHDLDIKSDDFTAFSVKPINASERLMYVLLKPEQYHSFVQLNQLIEEMVKQYYKNRAMRSREK